MKLKLLTCFFVMNFAALAQTAGHCGISEALESLYREDPTAKARVEKMLEAAADKGNPAQRTSSVVNYTIPVVFHVLHLGGTENISDAQIQDEIDVLNRDFTKKNPDTINAVWQFQNLIGNPGIEFRLATIDPNGNCTNGITRHYDARTNWTSVNFANYIYTWDRSKYLNIYVVKETPAGAAAYAFYPGSVNPSADAVVVKSIYVGSIGTSNPFVSRIITHEVGHWMNLQHVWGNNNNPGVACGDDGVTDTPVSKGWLSCSLGNTGPCTPNVTENIQNYMEYAYCQIMFTPGQCVRMQTALNSSVGSRNTLWSPNNLVATGITNPVYNCAPKAQFIFTNTLTCVNGTAAFTDLSYNGQPSSWQWSSPQASNISTQQNGQLTFTASGLVSVKLKVSNVFGSDSVVQQKLLVLAGSGSGTPNIYEGFENINFPDNSWLANVPQTGFGFRETSAASLNGSKCVWVDNFANPPSSPVSFYSPAFDLQNTTGSQLTFFYSYAQQSSAGNDKLRVYGSANCGLNWTQIFAKNASALSTNTSYYTTAYDLPTSWVEASINTDFYFGGKPKVYFKFEFTSDTNGAGNNIFIDDINLHGTVVAGISAGINVFENISLSPNPFSSHVYVNGTDVKHVTGYLIYDVSGRAVLAGEDPVIKQDAFELRGLEVLDKGVYFIRLNSAAGSRTFKVIKE